MKNSLTLRVLPLTLALLVLTGCATNRPPRSGSRRPVDPDPSLRPVNPGTVMPPPFEDPSFQEEIIVAQPVPPSPPPQVIPRVNPPKVQPKSGTPYTIKKGESLSAVAARHRMSWKRLAEYNLIQNPNRVNAGQVILIPPGHSPSGPATTTRQPPPSTPLVVAGDGTYVVQSGDNLSVIAQRYGTSVKKLKAANNLVSDRLLVGQILKLPQGSELGAPPSGSGGGSTTPEPRPTPVATRPIPPPPTPTPIPLDVQGNNVEEGEDPDALNIIDKPYPIIVQEGDTLQSIAENYIVTEAKIRELNNLEEGAEVTPGQKLMMPATIY